MHLQVRQDAFFVLSIYMKVDVSTLHPLHLWVDWVLCWKRDRVFFKRQDVFLKAHGVFKKHGHVLSKGHRLFPKDGGLFLTSPLHKGEVCGAAGGEEENGE